MNIRIRDLLAIRGRVTDQTLIDYLSLTVALHPPDFVTVGELCAIWGCHQSNVCRRMQKLSVIGLVDASCGHGGYHVHGILQP
jgi:hypothetical protein